MRPAPLEPLVLGADGVVGLSHQSSSSGWLGVGGGRTSGGGWDWVRSRCQGARGVGWAGRRCGSTMATGICVAWVLVAASATSGAVALASTWAVSAVPYSG